MGGLFELKYSITDEFKAYIKDGYLPEEITEILIKKYQKDIRGNSVYEVYILSVVIGLMAFFGGEIRDRHLGYIGRVIIICSEMDYVKELNSYEIQLLEEELNIINDIWESVQII